VAVLPLLTPHWWHANRNKGIVATALSLPVVVYLLWPGRRGGAGALSHAVEEYVAFIFLVTALYTISGGLVLRVLFFIFVVSNLVGLLTPLGDPPLFLGFLKKVPFGWTLRLWPQWLVTNSIVLTIFLIWDRRAFRHDPPVTEDGASKKWREPIRLVGLVNLGLLAAVLVVVVLQSADVGSTLGARLRLGDVTLPPLAASFLLLGITVVSLLVTPRGLRQENTFTWGPVLEVAVLFAGLFVTMVPTLALLELHGASFGLTKPWHYFWLTGLLSSILDNAPTYLAFGAVASGADTFLTLAQHNPRLLEAISCGAVFMGANTYIGNGPNFMVKAIADEAGVAAPSFFGYTAYAAAILLPTFVIVTLLFFRS